jgi:hypothetical protein
MRFITINAENASTPLSLAAAADYGGLNSSANRRGANTIKISRVSIANIGDDPQTVTLLLDHLTSGTFSDHYYILKSVIPAEATLIWDKPIVVNLKTHKLAMLNTGTNTKVTVTIE